MALAGTKYRGDFEKRLKAILKEFGKDKNAICLLMKSIPLLAGAASGGVMDASNLLKPKLSSGELRCIGSTTYQEYQGILRKTAPLHVASRS